MPDSPIRPSGVPAFTVSPWRTLMERLRMWQYCVTQPSPWSMTTPLPHSRPLMASVPALRIDTSGRPSRTPLTVPRAAASTFTPCSMAVRSRSLMSVPLCPS